MIQNIVHNAEEVDDVMQEIAIQLWDRADQYSREKGKGIAWLCTLTRRRAIDNVRQWAARSRTRLEFEVQKLKEAAVSCNGFDEIYLADMRTLVAKLMRALPPEQQQVVSLTFLHGVTQRQISSRLHSPLGTVKTRLELGLRKLGQATSKDSPHGWARALLN